MSSNLRLAAGGSVIALLVLGMLALPSVLPSAIADEDPAKTLLGTMDDMMPKRFDARDLVKYDVTMEPDVVTDVVSTRTIRKIGFGRTEFVEIVTTPSGIYSSDGLSSPHVRYPGIHKEWRESRMGSIEIWTDAGWVTLDTVRAGSFVSLIPFDGGQMLLGDEGNCAFVGKTAYC